MRHLAIAARHGCHAPSVQLGETTPTPERLQWAKQFLLDELLGDFQFKDQASSAHALAFLLLPYVRQMIDGPTPLHLVDSPTPGTGKGLLATVCTLPATGTPPPTMAPGRNSDDWCKRITAALLAGDIFVGIDNITQPLESGELASVLTQPLWQDRVLGTSHIVTLKPRAIWFGTANNAVLSAELGRRTLWIRLDANCEKPWERRGFRHKKLLEWAKGHRAEIVTAAVTLIRPWVAAGMPPFTGPCKGSYERWSEVMGGILTTVGVPGFLTNEVELYETTINTNAVLSGFIQAWAEAYGTRATGTTELMLLASFLDEDPKASTTPPPGRNLLGELLGSGNERSRRIRLGKLLREHRDTVIEGYKIIKDTVQQGVPHYRLEPVPSA
jgi:putative DNA primase/helicase